MLEDGEMKIVICVIYHEGTVPSAHTQKFSSGNAIGTSHHWTIVVATSTPPARNSGAQ